MDRLRKMGASQESSPAGSKDGVTAGTSGPKKKVVPVVPILAKIRKENSEASGRTLASLRNTFKENEDLHLKRKQEAQQKIELERF